jgi:hypothetical protein
MQDRPSAAELVAAVQHFLEAEILPLQTDQRIRFRTRVAANALAILQRELRAGPTLIEEEVDRLRALLDHSPPPARSTETADDASVTALRREIARRIRSGDADDDPWRGAVFATTLASVRAKLLVSNPKLLERQTQR